MVRGKRQVHGITAGVGWHQPILDVGSHDLNNGWLNRQERKIANQGEPQRSALR